MSRSYGRSNRLRRTTKPSGARGWYDGPQSRTRSRAWLRANPICVRRPAKATICDPDPPVRPHDREGVLRGADPVDVLAVPQREHYDRRAHRRHPGDPR